MYVGTDRIKRWLIEQGATSIQRAVSTSRVVYHGHCSRGPIKLGLTGITPNSLYSAGDFVPLTLRLDVGAASDAPMTVYAVRLLESGLWQGAASERYRGLVISGLAPISPLHRLTPHRLDEFLDWGAEFLTPDLGRVRYLAAQSIEETFRSLRIWERVSLGWHEVLRNDLPRIKAFRAQMIDSLHKITFINEVSDWSGGKRGPLNVLSQLTAVSRELDVSIEVKLVGLRHPTASLALDDFLVDVRKLESTAALLPTCWAMCTLSMASTLELSEVELLAPMQPLADGASKTQSTACCWLSSDDLEEGQFERFLDEVERLVKGHSAGPYR